MVRVVLNTALSWSMQMLSDSLLGPDMSAAKLVPEAGASDMDQ